jgi:hypothetical protein
MAIWGTSRELLARLEIGQNSVEILGKADVGQNSQDLLGNAEIQQSGSTELLGKFETQAIAELLGKAEIPQSGFAELLGNVKVRQPGSAELLGIFESQATAELLCNVIIQKVGSVTLYARTEVGQDSGDLFAKFEAQDTQVLYAKGVIRKADLSELYARAEVGQGSDELFAKAVVGQGSVELLGKGIVRGAASSDLKGIVTITHSINLLSKAVIGHPAFPIWLKGIFSIGLTNAYRDLESITALRRTTLAELFGKAIIRHSGSVELLCNVVIRHPGSAELLGNAEITNIGSQELLCTLTVERQANLFAKFSLPVEYQDSVLVIADDDLVEFLEYVAGLGRGFIGEPSVENDSSTKMVGENSFKITSTYGAGGYKEVKFGWEFTDDLVSLLGSWGIRYADWESEIIGTYGDRAA